ncbi:MAG: hypothetical protein QM638_12880 [Nocardioides sp.]|uniref:hypothetical protein n=1 Tax=Nocardioides sp. TaxID=35761 RepID=UPI0039E465E8
MRARVIVLAGPSGAGKSRLAERLGLPVLRLDDFYKDGDDPTLPRLAEGPNAGLIDWDHPDAWLRTDALAAIAALCETGMADVPVYEIARDGRTGTQRLDLGEHRYFVAEGIFAQDIVAECRRQDLLAAAYCLTKRPLVVFWRRLTRDLREHRKPPLVLVRRGLTLMREQHAVVADAVAKGCQPATPPQAFAALRHLVRRPTRLPWGPRLRQPDRVSCGPTCVVVARMLRDPVYAERTLPHLGEAVQRLHAEFAGWRGADGRWQLPWPRRGGSAFWSIAAQLGAIEGVRYRLRPAWFGQRQAFDRLLAAATAGDLAVLYVGTTLRARHITLVLGATEEADKAGTAGAALRIFNPASGQVRTVTRTDFTGGLGSLGRWPRPWTILVPAVPRSARRRG